MPGLKRRKKNFKGTYWKRVEFKHADLTGADLTGANLRGTYWKKDIILK